ncbi:hypothetical protein QAD02_000586 [Eretmocerus hayati]|uniref:Uncharacterized protein n=1 Tax=Eretmocerus hayati TaxID=131215 RepID=A0ACC2NGF8_9HYME|nr:hypothetical protein QAD02_000586 [Eretmocerus hayati]
MYESMGIQSQPSGPAAIIDRQVTDDLVDHDEGANRSTDCSSLALPTESVTRSKDSSSSQDEFVLQGTNAVAPVCSHPHLVGQPHRPSPATSPSREAAQVNNEFEASDSPPEEANVSSSAQEMTPPASIQENLKQDDS